MHPSMSAVHAIVPSSTREAITSPSCVPNTTRPRETIGGISMRPRPGIVYCGRKGGRSFDATNRVLAGDAPNIGQGLPVEPVRA